MAAEMADRVSSRRQVANGFFLTINTSLVSILGFFYTQPAHHNKRAAIITMSSAGIVVSLSWFLAIRSYKRLNKAKYDVITEMETTMTVKYFTEEWEKLKGRKDDIAEKTGSRSRWIKARDRYTELTDIEMIVPTLFSVIYLLILLGSIFKVIIK